MSKNESIMAVKPDFKNQAAFTFVAEVMDSMLLGLCLHMVDHQSW